MNLNLDLSLIEKMREGIILLNGDAEVSAYNSAASGWLREYIALTESVRTLIKRAASGLLTLPTTVQMRGGWTSDSPDPVDAWLCQDGADGFALIITQESPEQELKASESRFVALLGEQSRQEIVKLLHLLRSATKPGEIDRTAILQQSARVDRLLVEIEQLSTLFQRDKVFLEDRLSLISLLKDVLKELPYQRGEYAISYTLIETRDLLGVLYGDAAWLKYAFRNLLSALGVRAPPRSQVVLDLRQLGDFIVFTGRVNNAPGARRGQTKARDSDPASPLERDIRLQMCQRIIELHGGRLKLTFTGAADEPGSGIESFTLNLLTGLPDHDRSRASCAQCRYVLQSEAYARDLSTLMAQSTD